ncbi:uncharacterized protein LOC106058152 isoform X3 [Biomphalaria glabrata]|uniref:Uncharacterized protein LOC106058152 isoform X3 n=1 Tax=Biomphalaria glabrata TaxID=6526 RepID=A0A9W3AZU3_BIOGL|nr:uncharacterized protein LOC106058152 isoform X3 [Biomphalaria glabrata]
MEIRTEEHRVQTTRRWYQEIRIHREYLTTIPGILKMTEMEFIEYCISDGLLLMSAIVSAVGAPIHPGIAAAAVFNFLALAVFGVDTYYMFKAWQEHKRQLVGAAVVTEVTTTTTTPTK